jgi:hypothetical protein
MRLVPYLIAVAVIAIRLKDTSPAFARTLAWLGMAFVVLRIGGNTISFWMLDRNYHRNLAALDHVPEGARMVSFVGTRCGQPWNMSRLEHLPAMAIVRRRAYSNDQWSMAGAQLLRTIYHQAGGYEHDASEIVTERRCGGEVWRSLDQSLAGFPREAFDYVWLIQPPPYDPRLTKGLQPLWRSGTSVLYKVVDRTPVTLPPPAGASPNSNPPKASV